MKRLTIRILALIFLLVYIPSGYTQENYPQRIVSLGPSITKALYLLGVQDKLIANTIYCISPPQAKQKEKVGTAIKVNIERIFALKPDLVLATSLTDPKAKEKLKNLGIRVITFPTPKDFSDLCEQFLELAKLVGKGKVAKEIVEKAKNKIASIKEKVKDLSRPKVFVQIGARPLFAATAHSFINDYIEFAGGVNIAKEESSGIYSREQILKANPDVIIITTMGLVGEEEKKIWQNFKTLNAVKNSRIHIIDTDKITSPTPVIFVETLEEFVQLLHPETVVRDSH